MVDWTGKRKEWVKARDGKEGDGVKKGAVSGVSIGDSIDAVAKAIGKGYDPTVKAVEKLQADLKKYRDKIAKPHPKWAKWIDANLAKEADDLLADIKADLRQLGEVEKFLNDTTAPVTSMLPDSSRMRDAYDHMLSQGKTWPEVAKQFKIFEMTAAILPIAAERAKMLKGAQWKAPLPGFEETYALIKRTGELLADDIKRYVAMMKEPDFAVLVPSIKAHSQSARSDEQFERLAKLVKALRG